MYDLVIRNGTVVDGSGLPRYRADVAISGDRIAAIGRIHEKGREEIDATGQVVSPGFIDGHLLAYWVRHKRAFTLEEGVCMITMTPALTWGFTGRGLVREGYIADLNIFDPDTVAPGMPEVASDLPTGAQRLKQKSTGILATVIGGKKTFVNGEHTGALAGCMLRSGAGGIQ